MKSYAFAMPLLPGKIEAWKKYIQEIKTQRLNKFNASHEKCGLSQEQVWLQNTPMGDFVVVHWETDNPRTVFEHFMKSDEPYDKWFREKILMECHGLKPGGSIPPINEQILDYRSAVGEKVYTDSHKK